MHYGDDSLSNYMIVDCTAGRSGPTVLCESRVDDYAVSSAKIFLNKGHAIRKGRGSVHTYMLEYLLLMLDALKRTGFNLTIA